MQSNPIVAITHLSFQDGSFNMLRQMICTHDMFAACLHVRVLKLRVHLKVCSSNLSVINADLRKVNEP